MNRDERIILSFLTGKQEEMVDNIKRENAVLSIQEIAMFTGDILREKEMDAYHYLENNNPHAYKGGRP